ncbi:hypothetical protein AB9K26_00290 [Psychroserpens sp. XS_ASV72]|uniref:hypothetical protein n=1 Tax=Psychroserpens sp. XS_ASV72 TaxID=3241293 RepID=UPI003512627F
MNKLILYLIPLLFINCIAESNKHKIAVHKTYCAIDHDGLVYLPEFELLQNDVLIKKYKPELLKNYFVIDSLNSGNYTIRYSTIFKMSETVNFNINKKEMDTVTICLDKINYDSIKHITFIEKLKNHEEFSIDLWHSGSISGEGASLKIRKQDNLFYAKYNGQETKLTPSKVEAIKRFELELINLNYGGCSVTDNYTLKYNDEELIIEDRTCNWHGFGPLLMVIF